MKKLLNTLYVNTPDAYLSLDGETVVLTIKDEKAGQVPLHNIQSIVCIGYRGASPALMGACADKGIDLCFISPGGRFLARVTGAQHGNVLLREKQILTAADAKVSTELAKRFIQAKLYNCRWSLERTLRDHPQRIDEDRFRSAIAQQKSDLANLENAADVGGIMGAEGSAAKAYFGVFDDMILRNKDDFFFKERNRRPPTDRVNALLSLTYTIVAEEIWSALESAGLDPYVGFLHQKRPGRCSLALDMLEELRAPLADRFVLSLINLGKLKPDDFVVKENDAVLLRDDSRRAFFAAWQEKKQDTITHPFLKEKIPWGLVPYAQAMLLARYLRGDIDDYPPFFWK